MSQGDVVEAEIDVSFDSLTMQITHNNQEHVNRSSQSFKLLENVLHTNEQEDQTNEPAPKSSQPVIKGAMAKMSNLSSTQTRC